MQHIWLLCQMRQPMFLRKKQDIVVFRCENEDTVHERLRGFYNPNSQDAEGLSEYVLEQLDVILKGDFLKL